ncbi:MAG: ribosome maturation factor RimP, partial [Propionibacteriaceae bacterium]|nr:ribosome maturation factor RimP [Propionibacteriaceae bacterium]
MQAKQLRLVIEPVLRDHGLELDDLRIRRAGSRDLVEVTVDGDGAEGRGPNIDEITAASRALSQALDETDVTGSRPYVLEVSSRGIDRPLTKPAHWRRNTGRLVSATRTDGTTVSGRIITAGPDTVSLDLEAAQATAPKSARSRTATEATTANLIELDYTDVVTAQVLIEWNRPTT